MKRAKNKNSDARPTSAFEELESRQLFSAGALDPSFSLDGVATFPFLNGGKEFASNVAVQKDGKTVVVGHTDIAVANTIIRKFAVARFNFDGTPDRTFGQFKTGKVTIDVGDKQDASANAVAIQPDGKIVVVGSAAIDQGTFGFDGPNFAIVRLTADGLLDKSFDGDGKRTIDFGDHVSSALDVTLQGDGKILVVGNNIDSGLFNQDYNFAVARLNPNGSLDRSFDGDGRRQIGFGSDDFAKSVAIDPTGKKIIIAGTSGGLNGSPTRIAVVRLNLSNGARDATFGPAKDGGVVTRFPGRRDVSADGVIVQPSGKIVVAGTAGDATITNGLDYVLARYLPNGQLDTSFGAPQTGLVEVGFGGNDQAFDLIQSADGGIITAGTSNGKFAIAGLTADGLLDRSFGAQGRVITEADATVIGLAKGPGRRFVVAGGAQFKTARYVDVGANVVSLGSFDPNASEAGSDPASVIVARTERLPVPTRVLLSIGGTAAKPGSLGADYTLAGMSGFTATRARAAGTSGPAATPFVDIPAGQTFVTVTLKPIDDTSQEGLETATFTIAPSSSYSPGTNFTATVEIVDNHQLNVARTRIARAAGTTQNLGADLFSDGLIDQLL